MRKQEERTKRYLCPFPSLSPLPLFVLYPNVTQAATIQGSKLSEPDDMANTLQDAFKAYRGPCAKDAARCLSQAIDHYLSKGNFRRAATQEQLLAELYETSGERSKARSAYALAAQWFEDDNSPATANKLNLKAADLAALDSDYLDAIKRFEHVAKQSLSTNALRFSIKDYLLRAGICHLALDIVGAKRALDSYRDLDPQFPSTSQFNLLANLTEQVEKGDSEIFEDVAYQYDRLNPMSEWFKIILARLVSYFFHALEYC